MNERQRRRERKRRRHNPPVRPAWLYPQDELQLPAESWLVRALRRMFVRPVRP